ncbi:hypothetical protein C8R45DRAFT_1179242 [Mycena sanguinolenta]|nr:hypothetical protein C8R45DRAFT_1179242 [Mycena sanguinolenta]
MRSRTCTAALLLLAAATSVGALPAPGPESTSVAPCPSPTHSAFARALSSPGPVLNYFALAAARGRWRGKRAAPDSLNLHALDSSAPIPERGALLSSPGSDADAYDSLYEPVTPETLVPVEQLDLEREQLDRELVERLDLAKIEDYYQVVEQLY